MVNDEQIDKYIKTADEFHEAARNFKIAAEGKLFRSNYLRISEIMQMEAMFYQNKAIIELLKK